MAAKGLLSVAELRAAGKKLEAQLDALSQQVQRISDATLEPTGDPQGQRADEGMEDAAFERDRETLRAEHDVADELRDALRRVADGTYGVCESCARRIERERLELVAHARLCSTCARRAEERAVR